MSFNAHGKEGRNEHADALPLFPCEPYYTVPLQYTKEKGERQECFTLFGLHKFSTR
jgi:hypothetical protein